MSFGISVLNVNNRVQIDETYQNAQVYSTGSFYTGGTYDVGYAYFLTLPLTANLYISPSNYNEILAGNFSTDDSHSYWGIYTANPTLVYYIVTLPIQNFSNVVTTSFGLNVYNSLGKLAYTSTIPVINFAAQTNYMSDLYFPQEIGRRQYINADWFTWIGNTAYYEDETNVYGVGNFSGFIQKNATTFATSQTINGQIFRLGLEFGNIEFIATSGGGSSSTEILAFKYYGVTF